MLVIVNVPPRRSSSVVADHRDDQAALGRHRDAEMAVPLEDELARRRIEAGVELRLLLEREGGRLQKEAGQGEREAPLPRGLHVATDDRVELGDVGAIEVCDVRDERGRERHPFGDGATQMGQGLSLHRPPLLELRQRRLHADRP